MIGISIYEIDLKRLTEYIKKLKQIEVLIEIIKDEQNQNIKEIIKELKIVMEHLLEAKEFSIQKKSFYTYPIMGTEEIIAHMERLEQQTAVVTNKNLRDRLIELNLLREKMTIDLKKAIKESI